jgi:hypothetical protein
MESIFKDGLVHFSGQAYQGIQVVDRQERGGQHLFRDDQVAQISPGKLAASVAGAVWINRSLVVGEPGIDQIKPVPCGSWPRYGALSGLAARCRRYPPRAEHR